MNKSLTIISQAAQIRHLSSSSRTSIPYYFYNSDLFNKGKLEKHQEQGKEKPKPNPSTPKIDTTKREQPQVRTGPNIADLINEINDDQNNSNYQSTYGSEDHQSTAEEDSTATATDMKLFENSSGSKTDNHNGIDDIKIESFMDTNKIYKELKQNGFDAKQSEVILKLIRANLTKKLTHLNTTYSRQVELENESYLFKAAHNELLIEIKNSREIGLMNLTNRSIILKRLFNSLQDETSSKIQLNDNLIKMELNQFTHENNLHQKKLNLKNHGLNNRIISELVSGLRSNVEYFRWQLTRAGIVGILLMAAAIFGGWQVTKNLKFDGSSDMNDSTGEGGLVPILRTVSDNADEESHEYEADWDENVNVQVLSKLINNKPE